MPKPDGSKQQRMDALAEQIRRENLCPELAAGAKSLVMGDGSLDARILFIGEAPGKKEDELGLPFVGAAGKVLNELLASIDLAREEVYITSILKYRPPNNRDPRPAEKAAFWPYQLSQIEIIEPTIIATLGRHSMEYFLPGGVISQVHGQPIHVTLEGKDVIVLPLFHPAAALYNGKLRQTLFDDFQQLRALVAP